MPAPGPCDIRGEFVARMKRCRVNSGFRFAPQGYALLRAAPHPGHVQRNAGAAPRGMDAGF
jgi:hypothetical protein